MPTAEYRFSELLAHSHTTKLVPVVGEILNALLATATSRHRPLQHNSLQLLHLLTAWYAPDYLVPSILPGLVSGMTKIALGIAGGKGWANGEIVAEALKVMEVAIVRSTGDDVCIQEGAVRSIVNLEDLVGLVGELDPNPKSSEIPPYATARTESWLRGTAFIHVKSA